MAKTATSKGRSRKAGKSTINEGIVIHGARVHNLRNVHVEIPRGKFIVVTGVSGSGKSYLPSTLYTQKGREGMLKASAPMHDSS